jgi:hypothetical protein
MLWKAKGEVSMKICSTAVLGALALLAPLSAQAQGIITGLTLDLPAVKTCAVETITVTGTGRNCTFTLQLGDSTPPLHLSTGFPIQAFHAYSKAGTYTPTAQGQGTCSGMKSATLQVVGPSITSMVHAGIRPGAGVIIEGQNFGNLEGQVLIHLGKFGGQQLDLPLESLQWGDSFAAGTIPFILGVADQAVTFTVVSQCGATSNAWTANFTAARQFVLAPFNRILCATYPGASPSDECQDWGGTNWPEECPFADFGIADLYRPTGFSAYHASGWGFHGNRGNDQFSAFLLNGWVVDSVTGLAWTNIGSGSSANEWYVSPAGTWFLQVSVPWYADNCGMILYWGDVVITGPAEVPW